MSVFAICPLNFPTFLDLTLPREGLSELSARESEHDGLLACSSLPVLLRCVVWTLLGLCNSFVCLFSFAS